MGKLLNQTKIVTAQPNSLDIDDVESFWLESHHFSSPIIYLCFHPPLSISVFIPHYLSRTQPTRQCRCRFDFPSPIIYLYFIPHYLSQRCRGAWAIPMHDGLGWHRGMVCQMCTAQCWPVISQQVLNRTTILRIATNCNYALVAQASCISWLTLPRPWHVCFRSPS